MQKIFKTIIAMCLLTMILTLAACRGGGLPEETAAYDNSFTSSDTATVSDDENSFTSSDTVDASDEGNSEAGESVSSLLERFYYRNYTATENLVLKIDNYEQLTELYNYLKTADYYTLRYSATAYDDFTSGRYDKSFFDGGGSLVAIAISCASGTHTYYTYSETTADGVNIYIRRRNPYITIETCDIGRFVYLVPVASIYDVDNIKVVRSDSEKVTCDAFREKSSDTIFVSIFSGKYFRYDGNTYYTEAFSSLYGGWVYLDNKSVWACADGLHYKEVIKRSRDKIPSIKASEGMELCYATNLNVTNVEYIILSTDLSDERKVNSLAELTGLPSGVYYLVCQIDGGRTIAGDTERAGYFSIFLLDV